MRHNHVNYAKQIEDELIYQEITSNTYTLKGAFWLLVSVAAIWLLTMIGFFEVDKGMVSVAFLLNILSFLPLTYFFFRRDLSKPWIKYFLLTTICIVTGALMSILTYHAALACLAPLLFALLYRKAKVIWYTYAISTISLLVSSLIGFRFGLCDLNILLESQHVTSWYLERFAAANYILPLNENINALIIAYEVFPRSMTLLLYALLMHYLVTSNQKDAFRIAQLTHAKDTDAGTGIYNNNKYVEMLVEYYPKVAELSVLFCDLNNLKQINDTYGHANGDIAIHSVALLLRNYTSDTSLAYRIGGDEFVLIIENPYPHQAEEIIVALKESLAAATKDLPFPVTCATGCAYGKGSDILNIVKEADRIMYEDKKKSKKESE